MHWLLAITYFILLADFFIYNHRYVGHVGSLIVYDLIIN